MSTIKIKDADVATKYYNVIEAGTSSEPHEPVVPDYRIPYAINQIFVDDAVTVSVREKAKSLIKFGKNTSLASGVEETVWEVGGLETYPTTNTINTLVSTNAGDTQDVVIEGHTVTGTGTSAVFTFVSQTATLNGTTNVTLTTPLARTSRIYNNDSTDFAGTVSVFINGGTTHLQAITTDNQSLKCATTVSSVDYWIITGLTVAVERGSTATVDFKLQVREVGKTFRTQFFVTETNGGGHIEFTQPLIINPNSDVRLQATSNAASTAVSGAIHGYLAIIT
jgi:hypothetical protein